MDRAVAARKRALQTLDGLDVAYTDLLEEGKLSRVPFRWAVFIKQHKQSVGVLVRYAMLCSELKHMGHKMKNAQKDDPILAYILAARNADEHAEDHDEELIAKETSGQYNIGAGLVVMDPSSSISIGKVVVGGVQYAGFSAKGDGENLNVMYEHGRLRLPIVYKAGEIKLADSLKDINGKIFIKPVVPSNYMGSDYRYLAESSYDFVVNFAIIIGIRS